jgi:uncharacterized membrane protein YphA (DoxX/SURF4 family)
MTHHHTLRESIVETDHIIIKIMRKWFVPVARFSIAIIFIWFGILKVLGLSPAGGLVHELFDQTIHIISFNTFYVLFAWFEVLIGLLFLFPRFTRLAIPLLCIHMITTAGPLVMLPTESWSGFLIPTLVGQYIIKNLVIIAASVGIAAHVKPMK